MEQGFIDIINKVIADRGKSIVNNRKVFNSLLADYTGMDFRRERKLFIGELETMPFDEVMKKYASPVPRPAPQPAPQPAPTGTQGNDSSNEEESEYDELEKRDRHIKKGFKWLDEENNEKAARHFRKALSISPNGDAYFGLACCSSRAGDYDEAIDLLDEAKDLYEEEGDRKSIKYCNRAISDIQNTAKLKKENREGLINLGAELIAGLLS